MPAVTLSTQLIAHTQLSEESPLRLALPTHVPQGQAVALTAIRTCYAHIKPTEIVSSEGAKYFGEPAKDGEAGTEADRLIRHITRSGHLSTLEHLSYTFAVEGLSRAALAQLTRHRVGFSFSVQSQRFVKFGSGDKSGGFDYVVPESLKGDRIAVEDGVFSYTDLQLFTFDMEHAQHVYDQLRSSGVPAEDARAVLPQAAACNLTMTVNLRSLLDFYAKRGPSTHAQSEIKALATQLKEAVIAVEPWTAQFFEEVAG